MVQENKSKEQAAVSGEDLLSRWSRRKHAEQQGENEDKAITPPQHVEDEVEPPAQELTDEDMMPIDSLNEESDFSPFLSSGVSDGLRKQALRKLFGQPVFNITDNLDDYNDDFTEFASLGSVVTHEMKRALKRELEKEKNKISTVDGADSEDTAIEVDDSNKATPETSNELEYSDEPIDDSNKDV